MQTSIFLARLIGPFMLALGVAILCNSALYRAMAKEFLASNALIFLAGVITLPVGLAIVLTHNVWSADWRVIITVLGWLTVIAGALRMMAPQYTAKLGRSKIDNPLTMQIGGAVWLALGALLCFFGYVR